MAARDEVFDQGAAKRDHSVADGIDEDECAQVSEVSYEKSRRRAGIEAKQCLPRDHYTRRPMRLTYGVVTATLNARQSLARSLASTLGQSRAPSEVVVIDGGSQDGTRELAQSILASAPSTVETRMLEQTGRGIAGAWNEAIDVLRSDVVFLVNADDALEPGAAERVMAAFESSPTVGLVHGNARFVAADGREMGIVRPGILSRLGIRCRTMHPATMVRRDVYTSVGGFDPAFRNALDVEFIERCHHAGIPFMHIDQALATFTLGGVSNTQVARTDREMLTIGLRHSRTTIVPVAAYLVRRLVMRPLSLAGYHLSKREGTSS